MIHLGMDLPWTDITVEQPTHRARVLMKFTDGRVRIGDYSRFDWRLWGVTLWKNIPSGQDISAVRAGLE